MFKFKREVNQILSQCKNERIKQYQHVWVKIFYKV